MEIGYRDHRRTVDLDAPLATVVIGQIVKGDANADRFVLEMKNGGKSADLSGYSADGLFVNRLGMEVPLRATVSGSEIEMVLTGGCYDVGGAAVGHVRLVSSDASQIRTVIRFVADVTRDGSGVAYDPDGVIGDLDALLAKLTAMETATADGLAAAQEARNAGAQAIEDANAAGDAAKATAQAAADDATAAAETARATIYTRAMAIPDESALAASHDLHAQKDYPLNVAVHGYTYQEGEGDPSPENVRPIHGMDAAQVRAGGINLWEFGDLTVTQGKTLAFKEPLKPGRYVISGVTTSTDTDNYENTVTISGNNIIFHRNTRRAYAFTLNKEATSLSLYSARSNDKAEGDVSTWTDMMIEYGTEASEFEPYNPYANVITPPLLPDNSPLVQGDVVENWVRSGCDKKIVLDGTQAPILSEATTGYRWAFAVTGVHAPDSTVIYPIFSNRYSPNTATQNYYSKTSIAISDNWIYIYDADRCNYSKQEVMDFFAANPLTVFYRSTDYTPDKDLRVCRVKRSMAHITADGINIAFTDYSNAVTYAFIARPNTMPDDSVTSKTLCNVFKSDRVSGTWSGSAGIAVQKSTLPSNVNDLKSANEWLEEMDAAGTPVEFAYRLATPEIYYTDPLRLLPPAALETETVTVTASGESRVEYAHDTKHFIIDFVTKALASQS